jgi:phosphohistidine phosphatase
MKLYFLRHGKADWPDWKGDDDDRPLTKAGRKEVRTMAKFLVRLKVEPDLILTSPLPRAAQTAEIAAEELEVKCVEDKLLGPDFGLPELKRLQKKHTDKCLLLVGHEEDFSRVIAGLTKSQIKLAKGGVALVELKEPDRGKLRWLFPPKISKA